LAVLRPFCRFDEFGVTSGVTFVNRDVVVRCDAA
jgi:hypothetical protein